MQISDLPHLQKWFKRIEERPAVQKGLNIPEPNKFSEAQSEEKVQVREHACGQKLSKPSNT